MPAPAAHASRTCETHRNKALHLPGHADMFDLCRIMVLVLVKVTVRVSADSGPMSPHMQVSLRPLQYMKTATGLTHIDFDYLSRPPAPGVSAEHLPAAASAAAAAAAAPR